MLKRILSGVLASCFALVAGDCWGAIVLTAAFPFYGTDFNTYDGTSGTVPVGWSAIGGGTFQGQGNGTSDSEGFWAYGGNGDFGLGVLRSDSLTLGYSVEFLNQTGATITGLVYAFDYKQWRFANASGLDLSGTGALAGNTLVNSQDFVGSATGTNGTPVSSTAVNFLTGLSIGNNESFGFTWLTTDDTGADNGLAIDNFVLLSTIASPPDPTAVPEPSSLALLTLCGLGGIAYRRKRSKSGPQADVEPNLA